MCEAADYPPNISLLPTDRHTHTSEERKEGEGILFRDVPHLTPSLVAAPLSVLQMFSTYVVFTEKSSKSWKSLISCTPPRGLRSNLILSATMFAQSRLMAFVRDGMRRSVVDTRLARVWCVEVRMVVVLGCVVKGNGGSRNQKRGTINSKPIGMQNQGTDARRWIVRKL